MCGVKIREPSQPSRALVPGAAQCETEARYDHAHHGQNRHCHRFLSSQLQQ
jgi:hypothetical protein